MKDDQLKQQGSRVSFVESDLAKAKRQLEEASKTMREMAENFVRDAKADQQALAKKTKELDTVLREKKCVDCILCVEDIKLRANTVPDSA